MLSSVFMTDSGTTTSTLALIGGVVRISVHHCSRLTAYHGVKSHSIFKHNFCIKPYVPKKPRMDPSNRRLYEHGICIRHYQDSNPQPVQS